MAGILDFTHNAMFKVISDHTSRSCMPENPMVDTEIMKMLIFCKNCINLMVDNGQMAAILENGRFLSYTVK